MQRGCNAGRARHLRTTGSARATAPLEGTRPRAGRAPVQNGSHKKPIVLDGGLAVCPSAVPSDEARKHGEHVFCRKSQAVCAFSVSSDWARRHRVQFFSRKSEAVCRFSGPWNWTRKVCLAEVPCGSAIFGSAGEIFGSSYDRTRKVFRRKSYAVCSFSGPYTVWDLKF